jgi:hypothetical protein
MNPLSALFSRLALRRLVSSKPLAALVLICSLSVSTHAQACSTATVGGTWQNTPMASQTGTFTATFDATPSASPTNSVVGLSNGAQTAYANFACLTRFNTSGDIDARNGGAYAAASTIPYSAGVAYHFRLAINIAAQTYSIFVTPAGGSELTVGSNYAFRISDTTLNYWGVFVDAAASGGAGSVTACNFAASTLPQAGTPSFSPAGGSFGSAQTISIATATGGASIRYTTNGSTPSETAGTLYSGPVSISATTTLKAIAYKIGSNTDSSVASATYTITTSGGLNPRVAPGGNINLSTWIEQIPVLNSGGTITQIPSSQLVGPTGFQDQYFFTNTTTGAMEFWVPENGAHTTNSNFPRSELEGPTWTSGTHTQNATLIVNDTVGTVVVGQIHLGTGGTPSSTKPLLELFYHTSGEVQVGIEQTPAGGNEIDTTITTVPVGTKFSYTIKLSGNTITITVAGVTKTFTMSSTFDSEDFYFKAGAYLQTTGPSSTAGAHISFYALTAN